MMAIPATATVSPANRMTQSMDGGQLELDRVGCISVTCSAPASIYCFEQCELDGSRCPTAKLLQSTVIEKAWFCVQPSASAFGWICRVDAADLSLHPTIIEREFSVPSSAGPTTWSSSPEMRADAIERPHLHLLHEIGRHGLTHHLMYG
jgi:hypothetical protein